MVLVLTWVFFGIVTVALGATEWRLRSAGALAPDAGASIARSYHREAVVPLVRRAARQIVASLLLWLGVVAAVILAVVEGRPAYPRALIGGWTMPADIGLFAAVYLVAGRRQARGALSTPDQRNRTAALLLGAMAVGFMLGLISLVVVAVLMGPLDVFDGWWAHPLELAQAVTVPLVMAAVAVAAARWWPHPAVAPVVLIVLLFSPLTWQLDLYHVTGRGGWVPTDPNSLATGELAWHLLYLLGFAVFAFGLALLLHDRRLPPVALTAAGAFFPGARAARAGRIALIERHAMQLGDTHGVKVSDSDGWVGRRARTSALQVARRSMLFRPGGSTSMSLSPWPVTIFGPSSEVDGGAAFDSLWKVSQDVGRLWGEQETRQTGAPRPVAVSVIGATMGALPARPHRHGQVVAGMRGDARLVAAAVAAGVVVGLVLPGIGGRLAMRVMTLTSDPAVLGR